MSSLRTTRRRPARALAALTSAAALAVTLAACGQAGSSGSGGGSTGASGDSSGSALAACEPVAGDELVVLDDDQKLQTVDNVVPAVNAAAVEGDDAVMPLLDSVSAALDTDTLISLNKAVDVDRRSSADVAAEFVDQQGLAATDASAGAGTSLSVGAANFSESATLGEIYAAVLRSAGYDVTVTTIGARETYLPALEQGSQVQIVPEYVGTLTEFLNKAQNGPDAEAVASGDLDATVEALTPLAEAAGLVMGTPSPAQDQNAFAVTQAFAEANDVSTLSELAETCGQIVLGAGPECSERPFCQPGLEETYGMDIAELKPLDVGGPLTKSALQQGQITLGLVFSSDGSLTPAG